MRLLFLFVALLLSIALPGFAVAQWTDRYGNSPAYGSGYTIPPGEYGYRDSNGTLNYPPSQLRPQELNPTPLSLPPVIHSVPRGNWYNELEDKTPGNMYKSDSMFHDRVPTR